MLECQLISLRPAFFFFIHMHSACFPCQEELCDEQHAQILTEHRLMPSLMIFFACVQIILLFKPVKFHFINPSVTESAAKTFRSWVFIYVLCAVITAGICWPTFYL